MLVTLSIQPRQKPATRIELLDSGATLVFASEETIDGLKWRHLITASKRLVAGIQDRSGGHTTWCASVNEAAHAAMTWEWAIMDGGAIAFADILAVESNLYPLNEDGTTMSPLKRRVLLTTILNGMGWESAVQKHVQDQAGQSTF
jgi:hypothetical protein